MYRKAPSGGGTIVLEVRHPLKISYEEVILMQEFEEIINESGVEDEVSVLDFGC